MLRRPHLVLADACDEDAPSVHGVGERLDDVLGQQLVGLTDAVGWVLLTELLDSLHPGGVGGLLHLQVQVVEHQPQVAHNGHRHLHVLPYLRGVHVHVDDLGVGREGAEAAGDTVVEPHPEGDEQVRLLDGQVGVGHAVHSRHPHVKEVLRRERAEAQESSDDGYLGLLGQLLQLLVGAGDGDSVPRQDDRPLGLGYELCGALYLGRVPLGGGLVARHSQRLRIDELVLLGEHVTGDVHQDWAWPACAGDVEGLLDGLGYLGGAHQQVVVLGDGQRDARDVRLLEGIAAYGPAGDLAGDGHHRHRVHVGAGEASDQVGGARARGSHANAHPSGGAGVAVGGHGGALLVPGQDVAYLWVLGQRLVEGQDGAAREAKSQLHPLAEEAFAHHLGASESHRRHTFQQKKGPSRGRDGPGLPRYHPSCPDGSGPLIGL